MKGIAAIIRLSLVLSIFSVSAFAITWFPEEFTCPIDNEKNTFLVVGSYGSYIYSYPSKYQWLFFPRTDSPAFYTCKKCHLSTFMWDFDELPKEKLAAIRTALKDVKVSKKFEKYTDLPVTERLEIMEKVYRVLDKDSYFWEDFYRVKGYHYGAIGNTEKAKEARQRSLSLIENELADPNSTRPKKLALYISAAMKHFLGRDADAIKDLESALATKFEEKGAKPEDVKNAEEGLNERILDYIDKIKSSDKKPRLLETRDGGHGH